MGFKNMTKSYTKISCQVVNGNKNEKCELKKCLQFHNKKGNEVKSKGQGTSIIKELRN
jgi:hypothetical protein